MLDNDNDGFVDDPALCAKMRSYPSGVVVPMYEDEDDEVFDEFEYDYSIAELFDEEVLPDSPWPGHLGDATVEEILHNING